ncbi:MAG: ABC transporter ATP-binding protein/permease [Lachnospiraceae bacterium]|nr:ABC transporter ATP-binding protein/permease [Lachnospiraceae bacterium]
MKNRFAFTEEKVILKALGEYLKRYYAMLAGVLVLSLVCVAGTLYVPILIGRLIDLLVPGSVDMKVIIPQLTKIGLIVCATAILQWLMNVLSNNLAYRIVYDIRSDAFKRIQELPLSYLDKHPAGDLVSRIMTDADQVADGLMLGGTQLFIGIFTILGTLLFMLRLSWLITLAVVVVTPLSLVVASYIARHTYDLFQDQSKVRGEQTALIDEVLGNEKLVKAFGQEEKMTERFEEINDRLSGISLKALFYSSLVNPSTRFVNAVVYAVVALSGGYAVVAGKMTIGLLAVFLSYATQYTKPFNEISGVVTELQNAIACAGRILEVIREKKQIPEALDATALEAAEGEVKCEDVYFSYTPEKRLIENFSVEVKAGQNVAIVGPTGCGKTTVINLLMRFYDVDSGAIRVDGKNIREVTRKSLRSSYGMVLQETWLRSGTIRDNIRMGKPDAGEAEVVEAAKAAYADSFIRRLPFGYDTVIGEDGGILSQGQKQLLCIARVMLALPPMLILDEATSSIDTRTEMKIQSAFIRMMEGRTTFIVAHRLSTIRSADLILVMRDGNIVEQGTHESLMELDGFYAQLQRS